MANAGGRILAKIKNLAETVIFKLRVGSLKEKQLDFKGMRQLGQFLISVTLNCTRRLERENEYRNHDGS